MKVNAMKLVLVMEYVMEVTIKLIVPMMEVRVAHALTLKSVFI